MTKLRLKVWMPVVALTLGMTIILSAAALQAQAEPKSSLVEQLYNGGWPSAEETKHLHEQFLLQRAVQSYMMTLPILNSIGMRDGSEAKFGKGYNVLPIWKDRMNSKALVPTPNGDVIYSMRAITDQRVQSHLHSAKWSLELVYFTDQPVSFDSFGSPTPNIYFGLSTLNWGGS